MIKLNMRPE